MISPEREEMLARYAAHTLSDDEERELLRAALADQELFEALGHEHAMREIMDSEECRRIVVELASKEPSRNWLKTLFTQPVGWGVLAAAAAAAIAIAVIGIHPGQQLMEPASVSKETGVGLIPDSTRAGLSALMAKAPDAGLAVRFPAGDSFPMSGQLDVGFSSSRDAAILMLELASGERAKVLYPFPMGASARVAAGQEVRPAGAPLKIEGIPGSREIWLIAFPPGTKVSDCLAGKSEWPAPAAAHKAQFTVIP